MASLSNINGLFDVHSTGAILFSTSHGTSGQILRSNGNAAPTWVTASTVIGGPYLPLTGGTLSGPLAGTSATFAGNITFGDSHFIGDDASDNLLIQSSANENIIIDSLDETLFRINGSTKMQIKSSGNVGIGTTSPNAKLEVKDSSTNLQMRVGSLTAGISPAIRLQGKNTANTTNYYADISLDAENGKLIFNDPGTSGGSIGQNPMVLDSTGNVGIGTTSPEQKLHVEGTIQLGNTEHLSWAYDNGSYYNYITNGYNSTDGVIYRSGGWTSGQTIICHSFETYTSDWQKRLVIRQDGNVGIGTDSPGQKLEVNGNILATVANNGTIKAQYDANNTIQIQANSSGGVFGANASGATKILLRSYGDSYFTGGSVGIGTTSPGALLHVKAPNNTIGSMILGGGNNPVTAVGQINTELNFGSNDGSATGGIGGSIKTVTEYSNGAYVGMSFYTCKQGRTPVLAEAMRINYDGNVGIGTSSPGSKLHVVGANNTTAVKIDFPSADFDFSANSTSGYTTKFHMDDTGTYIGSNSGGRALIFQTNNTDRLYINGNNGNVGIGTTGPGAKLEVNGDILLTYLKATGNSVIGGTSINSSRLSIQDSKNGSESSPHLQILGNGYSAFHFLNTTAYYIVQNSTGRSIRIVSNTNGVKLDPGATAWTSNSDIALKENIKPLENVLDKIKDYRCVEYNLKESPKDKKIGFIAQDWVDDFPAIVNKDEKDMLGMKYTETIPVLLKAIQELTARIKELENK